MTRLFLIIASLVLSGCFGKDEIMPVTESERIEINDSSIGPMQIFYSLRERKIVAKNSIYAWDLAFDSREGLFTIRLNSAKGMGVCNTGAFDFNVDYSNYKCSFITDPVKNPNETAIGNWGDFSFSNPQGYGQIYLVNRGMFEQGREIGIKKLVVKSFKDSVYYIQFANPDGTELSAIKVQKKPGQRYVYFTFEEGGKEVNIEPNPESWDLLISPFTDTVSHLKYLFKPFNNLAVYDAILLNPTHREMAADSFKNYEEINFRHLNDYRYSSDINMIGKRFWYWDDVYDDFAVKTGPTYILRDNLELYYKFRFTEFRRNERGHLILRFDLKNL